MFAMAPERFGLATAPPTSRTRVNRSPTPSMWAVEERLATAERELRVQFTRIAQLQAELDVVSAALTFAGCPAHAKRDSLAGSALQTAGLVYRPRSWAADEPREAPLR